MSVNEDAELAELAALLADVTLLGDATPPQPQIPERLTRLPVLRLVATAPHFAPPASPRPPRTPPHTSTSTPSTPSTPPNSQRVYFYHTPTKSGVTSRWSEAAQETQGVPGAQPLLLNKNKSRHKKGGYAVFFGRRPGVYADWNTVLPLVKGVLCALFQGYKTMAAAQAAFDYAQSKSWTRVCRSRPPSPLSPNHAPSQSAIGPLPAPAAYSDTLNPLHAHNHSSDAKWYIVYVGITPGVYQSSLECQLNTVGLSGAVFDSVVGKDEATLLYETALAEGEVRALQHPYIS